MGKAERHHVRELINAVFYIIKRVVNGVFCLMITHHGKHFYRQAKKKGDKCYFPHYSCVHSNLLRTVFGNSLPFSSCFTCVCKNFFQSAKPDTCWSMSIPITDLIGFAAQPHFLKLRNGIL